MTTIGHDMAPAFRARAKRAPRSLAAAMWQRLMKVDARMAAAALGFLETKPRGAERLPAPTLDVAKLAVTFRQGLLGGATVEFAEHDGSVRVQRHSLDVLFLPAHHRSVSDILEDDEATRALRRNAGMSGRAWRRGRTA